MPEDEAAWGELFRLTWPFVLALCHRSLPPSRRALEAEDLAQEVYFKFARYWHEKHPPLKDRDSLFSLLAVITRRLAIDAGRWRSRARRETGREERTEKEIADDRDESAETDLRDMLDKICQILSAQERHLLSLRLQGYELSEIAQELKVSVRTVERGLLRIKGIVSSQLELDK